jgi:polyisoprenoid-binding protein YceI
MIPVLLFVSALAAAPEPTHYVIAPSTESRFALEVEKTGLMSGKKHLFLFRQYRGELLYDAKQPERSKVRLVIEAGSAELMDTWVSAKDHKKIHDYALHNMLAVEKYPEIVFVSGEITGRGGSRFIVRGMLTIRDVAKPVNLTVALDQDQQQHLVLQGRAVVNMKDYGLKPPKAVLGLIGTKEEMTVEFRLLAVKRR